MKTDKIRNAVIDELNRRNWKPYKLIKELGPDGQRMKGTIYRWLNEGKGTSDRNASIVLDVLGLNIRR